MYSSWYVNVTEPFFVMHKIKRFREKNCECDSYHISLFYICWSVVTCGCVFSAVLSTLLSNYSCQKTWIADFRYQSLKLEKIDNIDLTQHFSLSIFTDFRYHSIKITWLLSIFIVWIENRIRDEINFVVCLFVFLIGIIFSDLADVKDFSETFHFISDPLFRFLIGLVSRIRRSPHEDQDRWSCSFTYVHQLKL